MVVEILWSCSLFWASYLSFKNRLQNYCVIIYSCFSDHFFFFFTILSFEMKLCVLDFVFHLLLESWIYFDLIFFFFLITVHLLVKILLLEYHLFCVLYYILMLSLKFQSNIPIPRILPPYNLFHFSWTGITMFWF